jgi:hypothetical protein
MSCLICNVELDGKKLSNHIKSNHDLNSEEYTIKYLYNNIKPTCKNCDSQTRYVAFSFKEYCNDCSKIAMKEGGKKGGKAEAWNKGKTKENDERLLKQSIQMSGEGNPFFNKKHEEETKNRISLKKRLGDTNLIERCLERNIDFELLTPLNEYFSRQQQYLEFKCKKCNQISKKTLQAFERGSRCYFCNPIGTSNDELEILNWLKNINLNVLHKDRSLISPKEIDILIGDVGIEYNGLYWHSDEVKENEVDDFNKGHMLNKTKLCQEKGISLIHIFSDEWKYKKDICKSMILNRLKLNNEKIYARKCNIKEISNDEFNEFMNNNHISDSVRSSIRIGLFFDNKLVCAIGLRKPLQKKWSKYMEISRFASLMNSNVIGGLSKLLKYIQKELKITNIMTYADRRFGQGESYMKCGFKLEGDTGLDYWYTDCDHRIDRSKIQATKEKSEKEIATEMKLLKIWGCGSNIYVLN